MSELKEINLDDLVEFDKSDVEIFYSFPIEKIKNFLIQYKITVNDEELILELVKCKEETENELFDYNDFSIVLQTIIKLPTKKAKIEIEKLIENWSLYKNNLYKENENAKDILKEVYKNII